MNINISSSPVRTTKSGFRVCRLSDTLSVKDIDKVLGADKQVGRSSDGKVTKEWLVVVPDEGITFAVHDYRGRRWSVGGRNGMDEPLKDQRVVDIVKELFGAEHVID